MILITTIQSKGGDTKDNPATIPMWKHYCCRKRELPNLHASGFVSRKEKKVVDDGEGRVLINLEM